MDNSQESGYKQSGLSGDCEFFPASQETFTRAEIAPLLRELHAARQALREHEDRLSLALDGADAGLWDWDPITNVLTWTRQMERLYGIEAGAVNMYDHWRSRVHPDDAERVEAERDAALQEQRPFDVEFRIVLPSGEIRWLSARGRGMYDAAGALIRVTGINQDITRRKAAEAALHAGDAKFATLFELSPVALTITRIEDGAFLDVNTAFVQLSGYSNYELLGRSALELDLYADPVEREAIVAAVRQQGHVKGWPATIRRQDGSLSVCLMSVAVEPINGVPCFLSGIVDVGPLRQVEAALSAQQADMLALLENADSSIWSIDREYRLTACNSIFRRDVHNSLGCDLAIGDSVFQASDDETNEEWRRMYDRALAGERMTVDMQWRLGGRSNWTEYRFSPVRSAGGAITGVTVLGRDVTEERRAAQVIEEQLAEISLYFDMAPAGLAVLDTDLRYLRINKLLAAMNGVPVEEHIGKTIEEVVPDVANQARQVAARVLATGEPVTDIEIVGETPADPGVTHTWREHWYPIKRGDGTIIGFNVTAEDITERKRTRDLLERSQRNLVRAQEIGQLGSWEWDVPNDRLEWSDELYRIFGVDKRFVPSYAAIESMIHPDDRAYDNDMVQDALADGSKAEFEIRIIRPDGEVRHLYEYIEIQREQSGTALMLFGVVQDITERKLAEVALRHSQQNLVRAQQIGHVGSLEWDIPSGRLEWSEEMGRIFGVSADFDLTMANIEALIHPADHPQTCVWVQEMLVAGEAASTEYRIVRPSGEVRHIAQSIEISRDETGAPIRLFGIMQDITEQKRAAAEHEQLQAQLAQAQKMETVGRLAGGIAHDFNNMLAVIMLRSEMGLQMVTAGTPLHRSLDTIFTTAQRSANLVKQLLGYARKQTIAPRVIDLNATVEGLLPMLEKLMGEELELAWMPAADLWTVKMDSAQVDQILTNLCVNARDAIDGIGSISIKTANAVLPVDSTGAGKHVPPGEYVLLSVTDTGGGMEPAVLEHIFEPFYTTKGFGKGTGLGLATVDGIVQQNGGHIEVTSTPGAGTTFTVYLPRRAEGALPPVAQEQPIARDGAGKTLLLVEDEVNVLDMAAEVLRMVGYTVLTAGTPTEALRLVEQHEGSIDLLITDVILPVMNGAQLAARVTQRRPGIRTIYMSGYPADHVAHRGVLAEDTHFLAKPFSMQALAGKVQEVLTTPAE